MELAPILKIRAFAPGFTMQHHEAYLRALSIKHPALAIQLQSILASGQQASSQRQELEGKPIDPYLPQATGWLACAYSMGEQEEVSRWLEAHFAHRLTLLFQDLGEISSWLQHSAHASLVMNPKVQLIFLEPQATHTAFNSSVEDELRRLVWDTPGFSLKVWDPLKRFEKWERLILSLAFQRRAVANELIHYGRWNWPNLLRRLIHVATDRSLPSSPVWRGIPLLVCGAGPSLQQESETLKQSRDYFFIISAGTGINVLERLGIEPHLAMMVDPFRAQFSRFCLVDHLEIMHGAGWRTNYRALECLTGPRWLLPGSEAYPIVESWQEQMSDQLSLDEGYNVVGMALSVAQSLGADSIGILGVDLAFKGKRLYGAGMESTERYWHGFTDSEEVPVEVDGRSGKVMTLPKWLSEGQWLEQWASHSTSTVYRPGHEGLALPSIPSWPLQQKMQAQVQRDYDSMGWSFYVAANPVDSENKGVATLEALIAQIEQAHGQLTKARLLLESQLAQSGIDSRLAATDYWMQAPLPIHLEIELDQIQMDMEELDLYPTVLKVWEQCYRRIYECGFDLLMPEQMSWIHLIWMVRRLDHLIKGLDQLLGWCQEVQRGETHGFSEV